jgi:hypothetical protein
MGDTTLYEWTAVAATGIILALAVWVPVRRWSARRGGSFPDVPDAPTAAEPLEAPGTTLPYSSLDPFAPPKRRVSWSRDPQPDADRDTRPSR